MARQPEVFLATGRTGGVGLYTDCTGCAGMGEAAGMTGMPAMAGVALGEAVPPRTNLARSAPGLRPPCQPGPTPLPAPGLATAASFPPSDRPPGALPQGLRAP